jgi:hypothetical protein
MVTAARHSTRPVMNEIGRRLSALDLAFTLLDSRLAPQDFALVLHFKQKQQPKDLYRGAISATNLFPTTGSRLSNNSWVWMTSPLDHPAVVETETPENEIASFLAQPFDLSRQRPVRQLILQTTQTTLVSRFHHSVADGLSAASWLGHQLDVTLGQAAVNCQSSTTTAPELRNQQESVRRSRFAFDSACDSLAGSRNKRSGIRDWSTIEFSAVDLKRLVRQRRGFTYSDLLATCALQTLSEWNRIQDPTRVKVGLWIPMNVRQHSEYSFGNGSSRIRIYARSNAGTSLTDKCRKTRQQIVWSIKHGEWVVPNLKLITHLPHWLVAPVLRGYLNKPSVDFTTAIFSHVSGWTSASEHGFKLVDGIECIGLCHPRQSLAINGVTHQDKTRLTFTFDQGLYDRTQINQIAEIFLDQLQRFREEVR